MAPVTQYVFAEMLVISEYFAAGSHEWLPYSVIPSFSKQIDKHQFFKRLRKRICMYRNIVEFLGSSGGEKPGLPDKE